jgi:hypothetical protein
MNSFLRLFAPAYLLALTVSYPASANIVISEVMSAGSERALQWSPAGVPQFGFGTPWHAQGYDDSTWLVGNGPFGFGSFANVSPAPAIGTNTQTQMQNLTPTMYLRKSFTVSAADAARTEQVQLITQFNDGFVCYVNGVEVIRRNAGPPRQFVYRDQFAAYGTPANNEANTTPYLRSETLNLGAANAILVPGANVIAIHALNYWETTSVINASVSPNVFVTVDNRNNFYFRGDLRVGVDAPIVTNNSPWKYFAGVTEPSGGVYDPALLFSAKQSVPWGRAAFDDSEWQTGAAPFGAGTPPSGVTYGTNLTTQVIGKSTSVYFRIVFDATAADLAQTFGLQLLMDHDDSFVAYLNGTEVARDRLGTANAFTPRTAVADSARSGGSSTTYTLDPPSRLLTVGQNVLSVQVHNLSLNDADLFFRCLLRTNSAGSNRTLVNYTNTWRYWIGTDEPVQATSEAAEDNPEPPESQLDWLELQNTGTTPVSLDGWYLSDDPAERLKWRFPSGVSIPAGGYLLVVCDGLDITAPAVGGYLHTNFGLSADGETVTLSNGTGQIVQEIAVPALTPFHSYGRGANGEYRHQSVPTPRVANSASVLDGRVAAPVLSLPAGFHSGSQSVTITTATPGAILRYTTDGSEPTLTTGLVVGGPIPVTASLALRARAFKDGMIPSSTTTRTYLINEIAARRTIPALCITGDQQRSLYRPFGIMAISGGNFTAMAAPLPTNLNDVWTQAGSNSIATADLTAYNNPIHRGRFVERPAVMEILYPNGAAGFSTEFGMRIAGSGHARPRYRLTNQNSATPNAGAWSATDYRQKPSFNFYFRSDLGGDPLNFPLFPGSPVTEFHDLRCRAGKNDPSNPFVEDEFMRRLFIGMGQVGSRGIINTLYVNGVYKGYYNLCEHLREDFFQRHYGSDLSWDVRQVTTIASGDGLAFSEMLRFLRDNPQIVPANYQGMKTRLDVVNFADYLIVNIFGVTGDWPHNNFVCSRERSSKGLHRYHVWDAEGAFGDFSGHVRVNSFVSGTTGSVVLASDSAAMTAGQGEGIRILYHLLRASPEFKLLFADRLQKHFFNGGILTEPALFAKWNALKGELQPFVGTVTDRVTPWVNGVGDRTRYTLSGGTTGSVVNNPSRRVVLFEGYTDETTGAFVPAHLVTEGLWPATLAPEFSQHGGTVPAGFTLTITNRNAAGTVYYTTDGRDPRAEGGAPVGTAYGTPIPINFPTTIRARVRNTNGQWSPLTEAFFDNGVLPPLLITEIMYRPPDNGATDGDEYEFLEIKNVGAQTVNLHGMRFSNGITYSFPAGATIAPGTHRVIARNASAFAAKYPGVALLDSWGAGSGLSNSGEALTLADAAGRTVFSVSYSDTAPWPVAPDGSGQSLVPVNPNTNPSPNNAANWRASTENGGSPDADDPEPLVPPVYVNELLANSVLPETDKVELHNPNAGPVNVGDWWLSDDIATPKKYRIPAGTVIPGGGFLVIGEAEFNTGAAPFSFASSGDEVMLSSGDTTGNLTGYSHSLQFAGSEPGVSFGRYINSIGAEFFPSQRASTFGSVNSGPKVGPLVLTELMILPPVGGDEYIEVRNTSSEPLPLYDPLNPGNTWKVDGVAFNFPSDAVLQPGQYAIIAPLAPATFATKYNVPPSVPIFGPYTGALNNAGEKITLREPGQPTLGAGGVTVVPYIEVDSVTYDNDAPWPSVAGNGKALDRMNDGLFADDPANWQASEMGGSLARSASMSLTSWLASRFTPAQLGDVQVGGHGGDPDGDGLSNLREWAQGLDPWLPCMDQPLTITIETHADGQRYLTLRYRRSLAAAGLNVFVDTAAGVGPWNLNAAVPVGVPLDNGDGTVTLTTRDTVPVTEQTQGSRMMRVRMLVP